MIKEYCLLLRQDITNNEGIVEYGVLHIRGWEDKLFPGGIK